MPYKFPIKNSKAQRGTLMVKQGDLQLPFMEAIFSAKWENNDAGIEYYEGLGIIADSIGPSADEFNQRAESTEIRNQLIDSTNQGINQDIKAIFLKDNIKFRFIYFWFKFNMARITEMESESTMMGFSLVDLKKIPFWKPVRDEQTANAQLLSDGDTEISKLETKLARTRKLKQGLIHELLTERTRLV